MYGRRLRIANRALNGKPPQHQWGLEPTATADRSVVPKRRSPKLVGLSLLAILVGWLLLGTATLWALGLIGAGGTYLIAPYWRRWRHRRSVRRRLASRPDVMVASARDPAAVVRDITHSHRGGVFLGLGATDREWIAADPEHAVMVLGPPRSGKTSTVIIPAILSAAGAVVSTSTKLDVFSSTARHRSRWGQVWVFDPSGSGDLPEGAQALRWSPVVLGRSWDDTLNTSAVMVDASRLGSGGDAEYWNERAGAMLAGLLHAAALDRRTIGEVRGWVLRGELDLPRAILRANGATLAAEVLDGLARAGERALTTVFATASSVLTAYNSDAALAQCENPNFDARSFVNSDDTVYITAPAHLQARLAPLVVGLLEEIRRAAYARARALNGARCEPLLWALDEVANIAPLGTLPAILSEGGGQGLQTLACFQDLAQARARWGAAAEGFLSLFGTKIVFAGIGDVETLRALSTTVGMWDRPQVTFTDSWSASATWHDALPLSKARTRGGSVSTTTQREAVLSEADIANLPRGTALFMQARRWTLISAEPFHVSPCWRSVDRKAYRGCSTG